MFKKYKNIATFLIISFFLIAPFVMLKGWGGDYEIFPAALFPGGADRLHIGDEIVVSNLRLYGKSADNNEYVELDKLTLFKFIHIHHLVIIESREHFGALAYDETQPEGSNSYIAYATPEDIAQSKKWFRDGLLEQHCKDSTLLVRETEIKIDKLTRKIISETTVDEKVLKLY
tara:strand:- start:970 stop:1488 length:519 start_codon:yes stop_codon:yes gene_type:complete